MPWGLAVGGRGRPFLQGPPVLEQGRGTAPAAAAPPFPLGAGQIVAPVVTVLRAGGLGGPQPEPAGDLLRRPARFEPGQHLGAPGRIAVEATATPTPGTGQHLGIPRAIALLAGSIALQLARNGRWRAIQSCSDLPERAPLGV